jgi:hydroxymethylpyrimidine/phosphomethylpyrimidine kinase
MTLCSNIPIVLSIAGSDPSGGAGIQADIKTCTALGVYSMAATTALTAQNSYEVRKVYAVESNILRQQLNTIADDITPNAIKIGMIPNAESVEVISNFIKEYNLSNIVLDPVLSSTSGTELNRGKETIDALLSLLTPLCDIITPNIPEIKKLTNGDVNNIIKITKSKNVLIKGGHSDNDEFCIDILIGECSKKPITYSSPRINSKNTHGTGCALSSAIASGLAKGLAIPEAVDMAKQFVSAAIASASNIHIGHGHGPLDFLINNRI